MAKALTIPPTTATEGTSTAPRRSALVFALTVMLLASLECTFALFGAPRPNVWTIYMWGLAALGGQLLSFPTPTGRGRITLAMPIHLAMAVLLGPSTFLPAIWLSRLVSDFLHKNRVWYKVIFNTAQVSISVLAAHTVYRLLLPGIETAPEGGLPLLAPAYGLLVLGYYIVNMSTVGCVIALSSGDSFWKAWRKNYGYRIEVLSAAGLALLGPLLILVYRSLGGLGLVLFLLPMIFVWKAGLEVIALKKGQAAVVVSERLAERGELAIEIGNEINQYLTQIYGQVQLMLRNPYSAEEMKRRLGLVLGELGSISSFTKGLIDSSRRPAMLIPTDFSHLIESAVTSLRLQGRLEDTNLSLDLDESIGEIAVDALQFQQVIRNLLLNAIEAGPSVRVISRRQEPSERIEVAVVDNGPGIPESLRARILDAGFTTKPNARGMGLSTAYRIIILHQGQLLVENAPEGGARFRVLLPASLHRGSDSSDKMIERIAA